MKGRRNVARPLRRWPLERTLERRSIRVRILGIVGVFLTVLVVLGVSASTSAARDRQSATINNVSGRQGTLAQRLVKEALLRSQGFTVDLEGTVDTLRTTAKAVIDGGQVKPVQGNDGEITIPGQRSPAVRAKLASEADLVEQLVEQATTLAGTEPTDPSYRPAVVKLEALSHLAANVASDALGRATSESRASIDASARRDRLIAVAGALLAIACSALVLRSILRPLRDAAALSDAVRAGILTDELEVRSSDELGRMGHGLNAAVANLRATMEAIGRVAGTLGATAAQLESSSGEIREGAAASVASAHDVSSRIDTLGQAVARAVGDVERVRAETRSIAGHAEEATNVADSATVHAGAIAATVAELSEASDTVESVVALISAIAEETNLLALNATIEAARAGEAGRGFAVVANEVKQLAQQTAEATTRVTDSLGGIRRKVAGAVEASERMGEVIATIGDRQRAISAAVEVQLDTTLAISGSVDDVRDAATQMEEMVVTITGRAEQNLTLAQSTDEAASGLGRAARGLQELMDAYRY